MKRSFIGEYILDSTVGETVRAFVPSPLPPEPPLDVHGSLQDLIGQAHMELGRLDGMASVLPDTSLFIYMYVRKEALLSSQIEGTQSSLSDLLLFELDAMPGVPMDDVREVSSYVSAMEHGLRRLKEGFPLRNRLLCEIHGKMLSKGRGSDKSPGEFRKSQNWIGGTRPGNAGFVPPPPERMGECLSAFEKFLNNEPRRTPTLIKAALAHVQFESIHPFLDGNGRLGRLLITLLFCHEKFLNKPLLYLSLYFKQNRQEYYNQLQKVRTDGDWESWVAFFSEAVKVSASQGVSTAKKLTEIIRADRNQMNDLNRLGGSALRVLNVLARTPIITVSEASRKSGIVESSVSNVLKAMCEMGIVKELTGQKRNRIFSYHRYLKILSDGTEPIK